MYVSTNKHLYISARFVAEIECLLVPTYIIGT